MNTLNIKSYKTLNENKSPYRSELSKMLNSGKPVFTFKLDTTGLDPNIDQVIKVGVTKCHFEDYQLVKDNTFERLIHVNREVPDYCFEMLNIQKSDLDNANNAEEVMKELLPFLGTDPLNVVGFYTKDFIEPFLNILGFYSGYMLKIANIVDMYQIAIATIDPSLGIENYKFRTICEYLGVDTNNPNDAYYEMFNALYNLIPLGQTRARVIGSKYTDSGIYITTECGTVILDCKYGYFREQTPGIFNVIDLDYLTQYICEKQNCENIREFIVLYKNRVKK